tara:strand:+ start:8009 stop:9040 length:1032 start_codon:yes stop_codon:yes gene_type:complete
MAVTAGVLISEVSHFLGYGYASDASGAPTGTGNLITNIADRALKDFLMPPPMPGERVSHIWSWLRSNSAAYLNDPYTASHANSKLDASSGPVVANGTITFNFTGGGAVPTWAFSGSDQKTTVVEVSGLGIADGWHIPSALTATTMTLAASNADLDVSAKTTGVSFTFYQVFHDAATHFSGFDGPMVHDLNTSKPHIEVIPWNTMMNMYSAKTISPNRPQYVSYDEKLSKFMFYPPPDADYVLRYGYLNDITHTDGDGSEVIPDRYEGIVINAALAIAEGYADHPNNGTFARLYAQQLQSAVAQDRTVSRIEYFGYNGDSSDKRLDFPKYRDPNNNVTYNSTLY